jgi:capsular exopolysaccharide synthesis family protein
MSRIDEALRRASVAVDPRFTAAAADEGGGDQSGPEHGGEAVLHEYPREQSTLKPEVRKHAPKAAASPSLPSVSTHSASLKADSRLVLSASAGSMAVEQYRRLAAAVHELQIDRGLKTMMVTSALPKEGKTLTVTNLALTLSHSYGRRVLLIDADLRRPSVHGLMHVPNVQGLFEVLQAKLPRLPILEVAPLLDVLTAGRPNADPMAVLTSDRMRLLLAEASASYDWVLLDAPPVGIMPDAALLAGITGASLFVVGAGSTPYKLIERAVTELGRERIVGTVLNRIAPENIPATGYYESYYAQRPQS